MKTPVAITGLGAVTPYGSGVAKLWSALLEGRDAIREIANFEVSDCLYQRGGEVDAADYARVSVRWSALESRALRLAAEALAEALSQARLTEDDLRSTALIAATNFDQADILEGVFAAIGATDQAGASSAGRLSPDPSNILLRRVAGLGGNSALLSLSCSSGAAGLVRAAEWLRRGRAERVVVVGYDSLSRFAWSGLSALRTMTQDAVRPFDSRRAGTLFSEGAAALVLERADIATGRGAEILATLDGWATGNNGTHMTAPAPQGAGSADVMRRAMLMAGCAPESVDHFNAHGTGTKLNDSTESEALHAVLGERAGAIPTTSNKGAVGHLMGAAGTAEAVASVMSIREGLVPPTANHAELDPACPVNVVAGKALDASVSRVLSNSAGIGGSNAALLISKTVGS